MKCPNCNFENLDNMKFCGNCGQNLEKLCPQCQTPVPLNFKFCGNCGCKFEDSASKPLPLQLTSENLTRYIPTSLAEKITKSEQIQGDRRQVTVLFSDVSGFTTMSELLDPEEVTNIINDFFKLLVEPIYKYEGMVDKFVGDCIMALFGVPIIHEDDAVRAVLAALDMQAIAKKYSADLNKKIIREKTRTSSYANTYTNTPINFTTLCESSINTNTKYLINTDSYFNTNAYYYSDSDIFSYTYTNAYRYSNSDSFSYTYANTNFYRVNRFISRRSSPYNRQIRTRDTS